MCTEDAEENVKEVTCVMTSEKLERKVRTAEISKLFIKNEDRPQNP